MLKTSSLYVAHIQKEIAYLQGIADKTTFENFKSDESLLRAAAYSVQIISEAVRKLPPQWISNYGHINWIKIKGIGNFTRHEYFRVDPEILWQVIVDHIQYLHLAMLDFEKRADH